jgi:hypothetical protein
MAAPLITLQTTSPAGRSTTTVESRIGAIVDAAVPPMRISICVLSACASAIQPAS